MRLSKRQPLLLKAGFLAWAACGFACGGDDERSSQTQGPRLEWDQQAESLQQAQSLSFRLYVDDVGRPLNGAACRVASDGAGHVCAAPLPQLGPGRHVLQLASVLNGVESARSEPLTISGDSGPLTLAQEPDASRSSVSSTACLTGTATECYAVRAVASGFSGVRALSPAPDGRLFVVEGNASIRVVADGSLIAEPALALKDERARIAGIAVDAWSFPESRFVFVAWTEETRSDHAQLHVTRYREVANMLGEGATILTGIPVSRDVPTSLAVDRNGHVYVAVPGFDLGTSSAGSGVVLRITRDGRVPPDNRLGLAAFASGFSSPSSLFLDSSQKLMWLGGQNPGSPYAIGVVSTSLSEQAHSLRLIAQVGSDQPVSFVVSRTEESSQPAIFVVANGRLSKALRARDGSVVGYTTLDLDEMRLTTAAATERGSMYVATETAIFELARQ